MIMVEWLLPMWQTFILQSRRMSHIVGSRAVSSDNAHESQIYKSQYWVDHLLTLYSDHIYTVNSKLVVSGGCCSNLKQMPVRLMSDIVLLKYPSFSDDI